MLENYILVAWRNLKKNRTASAINIGGLSIGMAVTMLIALWIRDELTFNRYHAHYDTIGQIYQRSASNGRIYTQNAVPFPLGRELREKYGDNFSHVAMASWQGNHILSYKDKHLSQHGMYIEKDGPSMLTLRMKKGSLNGFSDPRSILLSASAADAIFGDSDPVNQVLKIDSRLEVKVTGVFEDLPANTRFHDIRFLAPWDLYVSSEEWVGSLRNNWNDNSFQLFVKIRDNADFAAVNRAIINARLNNLREADQKFRVQVFIHPMSDWHLFSEWENGRQTRGSSIYIWMFGAIGAFVLLLACINFMNLSTARSAKRAREVGIRKTIGSERKALVWQFLLESVLVAFMAFLLALLLAMLALPWYNAIAVKQMHIPWSDPLFWAGGLGFTLFTGLLAGSYPALYLSSFNPVNVLKGTLRAGSSASLPRKVLVVIQFTVSVILIIGTGVVYKQLIYSKNRPVGYDRSNVISLEMMSPDYYAKYDVLRNTLKANGAVEEFSGSSSPLTGVYSNTGGFNWEGKDPDLDSDFGFIWVTHDYGNTIGWQIKEGRDFSRDFPSDSSGVILNESAVRFMNIKDPVGKVLTWENAGVKLTVVGVVKDMIMTSPFQPVKQTLYALNGKNVNYINIKLNPNRPVSGSLAAVEKVFKEIIPNAPFSYSFVDRDFASKFSYEERIGKLAAIFSGLAIVISALGLFGLASFMAEQRTKEIGIRKIAGASAFGLWRLLSRDFLLLTAISCVIAIPVAWYLMQRWLENYAYRTSITWDLLLAAVAGALLVTLVTVSYQTVKAALSNPVRSLRSE